MHISNFLWSFFCLIMLFTNCEQIEPIEDDDTNNNSETIVGFNLLKEISGHWVGSNETAFGNYDWFAFDYRPISSSHAHAIYEGGTAQNIITSFFIADFEDEQKVMARNGGWLGPQYRATYFVLDMAEETTTEKYYRLVDAVGGENRAYMEIRFKNDSLFFNAYKDNSGSLDAPIVHMQFKGSNYNPNYATSAINLFDFPQAISEVNLNNQFNNLVDPDSALFLEESQDPFPKSMHGFISDLNITVNRAASINNENLLLYLSKAPLIDSDGNINLGNINTQVVRTITVASNESEYTTTYLHPDNYYITIFADRDGNFYPSSGDVASSSTLVEVTNDSLVTAVSEVNIAL